MALSGAGDLWKFLRWLPGHLKVSWLEETAPVGTSLFEVQELAESDVPRSVRADGLVCCCRVFLLPAQLLKAGSTER